MQYFTYCGIGDKACSEDILEAKTPRTVYIPAGQTSVQIKQIIYSYSELEPYTEFVLPPTPESRWCNPGTQHRRGHAARDNETTLAPLLYAGGAGVVCGAGTQTAHAVVILSSPQSAAVGFQYTTSDGTAAAGTDYTTTSGSASIPAGGTQFTIPVPILPCTTAGPTKTFSITISNPTGPATIQLATGTGTVLNII